MKNLTIDNFHFASDKNSPELSSNESPRLKKTHSLHKFDEKLDINQQFKFLATIGKGAYGSVILVQNAIAMDDQEIYAIKVLKYMEEYKSQAEKEEHIKNLT